MFIDTHAHVLAEYYEDIDTIINNAKSAQVNMIINNGCDAKSNQEVLANLSDNMVGALGIHPESVLDYTDEDLKILENNLNNPRIVAIGEIGLDYHYGKENREKQIELFSKQLELALKYQMPVIIHSRDATQDTIDTLKKYPVRGVIHSFSGSLETARIYIKMGFLLGVNGVVTFKNAHLKEIIKEISLENIVLETDSPYLTPEPYRGKRNEPQNILTIAKFLSAYLEVDLEDIAKITTQNAKRIFDKLPDN